MDDLRNDRSLKLQATWVIDVFGLFCICYPWVVFTSRHLQMSGRLVKELNICTVGKPVRICMLIQLNTMHYFDERLNTVYDSLRHLENE